MKTTRKTSRLIGIALGRTWRGWLRLESWFSSLIKKIGIPVIATKIVLRLLLAAGIVKLLFATGAVSLMWAIVQILVMIVLMVIILVNWQPFLGESSESQEPSYFPEDPDDHRNQPGYDSYFYPEDDPDPRFKN